MSEPSVGHVNPSFVFCAPNDRVADSHLRMAVLERAEVDDLARLGDVRIHAPQEVLQTIGIGFGVTAGVVRIGTRFVGEQDGSLSSSSLAFSR